MKWQILTLVYNISVVYMINKRAKMSSFIKHMQFIPIYWNDLFMQKSGLDLFIKHSIDGFDCRFWFIDWLIGV